jgi:hypothetical protein
MVTPSAMMMSVMLMMVMVSLHRSTCEEKNRKKSFLISW